MSRRDGFPAADFFSKLRKGVAAMPPRLSVLCLRVMPGGSLHTAIDKDDDLGSRAVVVGAEQAADTAGDVVLLRPGDRRRVVSVRGHRGKFFCRPLSVRYFFSISSCKSRLTWV